MQLKSKVLYIFSALLLFVPPVFVSAQVVEMTTISGQAMDENGNIIGSMHVGANLFSNPLGQIGPIGPGGPNNPGPGGTSPLSSIQLNMPDLFQYSTDSDENGNYTLRVPPGDYRIVARSGRYSPVSPLYANQFYPGVFDFYSASSVTTSLSAPAEGINFFLREGRTIEGKISAYGEPLAGIFVRARSFTTPAASGGFTNVDGLFSITLVPAPDYRISTFSLEYTNEFYKEGGEGGTTTRYDDATLVDITGASYSGVEMSLVLGGTINGYVLEKNGVIMNPGRIANASVYAVSQKENWSGTTTSSKDGSYALTAPRTDDLIVYYLPNSGDNYIPAYYRARDGSSYSLDGAVAVDISLGSAYGVNMFMRKGVVISGNVSDDSANSVANVQINAFSSDFSKHGSSLTDENGDFSFVLYPGKNYILSAYTPTYGKFFYGDLWTVTSMDKASLVKTYSGRVSNLNITMLRGNNISGVIYNADSSTASGVTVSAFSESTGNGGETQSGSDGSYSIVVPGSEDYIVWSNVTGKPDSFYVAETGPTTKWESASSVRISNGDQGGINITIPEYKTVSGTLSDPDGNPLAGKWVIAYSVSTGENGIETTDASGGYFIGLPVRNDYVVYAFETENFLGAYYSEQAIGTNALEEAATVDLANDDGVNKDIQLKFGVTVSGYVENRSGGGVTDAWIVASSKKLSYINGTFSSSMPSKRGSFSLTLKPSNDYIIEVFPKNGLHKYLGGSTEKKNALLTDATENVSNLLFSVSRGNSVQGYILYEDGRNLRGLSGATVLAYSPGTGITGLVKSGVDGRYTVELPLGVYLVCAWTDAYPVKFYESTWWEDIADSVELGSSDVEGVNITLKKGCNIQGRVWVGSQTSKLPVADDETVYVVASSRGRMFKTALKSNGTYIFRNLPPTRDDGSTENFGYKLTASSNNLSREYYDKEGGTFDKEKAVRVNLRAGENVGGVNFYLNSGGSITGSFTAAEDLSGSFWARLKSASGKFQKEKKVFPSSSVGSFTFTALPLDLDYRLSIWAEDFEQVDYKAISLTSSNSPYTAPPVTLTKGVSISGVVQGSGSEAVQNALVSVIGSGEGSASTTLTDKDGNFRIQSLDRSKKYRVQVSASGFVTFGGLTSGESYSVPRVNLNVILVSGFRVSGLLQDSETGDPVSAYISLYTSGGEFVASAAVGDNGNFSFASYIAPADYELKVFQEGNNKVLKAFTLNGNVNFELKL